ncbi:MAG: helix-turn-helix domain-containing protein [Prevotella sp.]|nr:helix-turn-helix domain-containing protein [Prevotella sp.]
MKGKFCILLCSMFVWALCVSGQRHWMVADGLPTGEVQQIVELPNGQMLVNCEGVFCLSNGHSFDVVSCNQILAYKLSQYTNRYGQLWEGDSILWLRDFYRIYRFDAHQYRFVKTDENGLGRPFLKTILADKADTPQPTAQQQHVIDSLHIHDATVAITDRQGGLWIGTRTNGIVYQPPHRTKPMIHTGNDPLIGQTRSASLRNGQTMFVIQLHDGRQLRCDSLCHLAYALQDHTTISLNAKLPALNQYRYMVGACPMDGDWVAVYTQNGAFLLDTKADTLASFPYVSEIERYSSKYNCMLKDGDGRLWVGTQNGLFSLTPNPSPVGEGKCVGEGNFNYLCQRASGLANNCIRSLVMDADGHVWAGTSFGISRITPSVVNLSVDDGIPATTMMDRSAILLDDGRLIFAIGGGLAVSFRPDEQLGEEKPLPVVITNITINGETVESSTLSLLGNLSYKQNYLSFQFSTLNYATPSHDRYRYRIRNLESEWNTCSDGGGQCTAIYRALPPGDYTFEVQAATASSEWGTVTTFQFAIRPPWWLTWWMKTAYGLATILMIVGLISVYLQKKNAKLKRENDERVNHLFELREEARHQFAESANISPDKIAINAEEEKLVSQMLKAIEAHIDNEQYNADLLARDVAMSRASLYKKLQNMLGITPTDFIRKVRLKRAAQLLTESQLSINEIATHVGFATARNFSSSFKKIFGVTPSEYRNREENAKKTHN